MDWQKTSLIIGMAVSAWLLVIQWNHFSERQEFVESVEPTVMANPNSSTEKRIDNISYSDFSDELPSVIEQEIETSVLPVIKEFSYIRVTTDLLEILIDPEGGDIVKATLLKHKDKLSDAGKPIVLLDNTSEKLYIARSGIIGRNATDTVNGRPVFTSRFQQYNLTDGSPSIDVDLLYSDGRVDFIKRFTFNESAYHIDVTYLIRNNSNEVWSGVFYGQLKRDSKVPDINEGRFGPAAFLGAAIREPEKNFAKYDFDDIADQTINTSIDGGWISMVQLYYISAWVPPVNETNNYSLRKISGKDEYVMSFTSPPVLISPGSSGEYSSRFYVGPKDQKVLSDLADYLDLTVDYGFLWMVGKPIFMAMEFIESYVGNWGWAIILVTILIKLFLYPLSKASLKSMAKMRELQPEMNRLKELYGDDRQKMSQELMGLYKKEKVNPAGGCFPILLQMPVFLALYWVLLESVEIRHAPWIFWIQDLSSRDPYFILPLIMGGSMLLMQRTQPMPTDPLQAKIMKFMPIAFTLFCMSFPSGLVLYWTINNIISMGQQYYVNKQLKKPSQA
tara:strand:- start:370 stop:2052 length:1683 start_codon:yes stop_codon:yes gene_type:complete